MAYRRQALIQAQQEQARRDAVADSIDAAGRSMESLGNPPQNMTVIVTCTFGCRYGCGLGVVGLLRRLPK